MGKERKLMGLARRSRCWTNISLAAFLLVTVGLTGSGMPFTAGSLDVAHARSPLSSQAVATTHAPATLSTAKTAIDHLPMIFEAAPANAGAGVRFLSRGNDYALYLTDTDAILIAGSSQSPANTRSVQAQPATIRFHMIGSNAHPRVLGTDQQPATTSYFVGNNAVQWRTGVHTFGRVLYHDVYAGINLVYYGTRGSLEYDYQLAAGVSPSAIRLSITGDEGRTIDAQGNLAIATSAGTLIENRPVAYQIVDGRRHMLAASYALHGQHEVGISVSAADPRYPLIIDPTIAYSDLFGSNTSVAGIALDRSGDAYFAGTTYTVVMTTTSTYQALSSTQPALRPGLPAPAISAAHCPADNGGAGNCPVAYVAKLNSKGTGLLFETYIGGTTNTHGTAGDVNDSGGYNIATGLAVDARGFAYVVGYSNATNFPTTVPMPRGTNAGGYDAFLMKLAPSGGKLVYSTLLGGTTDNASRWGDDIGTGVAVDSAGDAYITGYTYTYNFPVQGGLAGKLGYGKGTLGGQVDAFVTKFSPDAKKLIYSTYLGGSGSDTASAIALDRSGDAYVAGQTTSPDFPTPPHALQSTLPASGTGAFVAKLNKSGNGLVYATYLGQSAADIVHAIAVDGAGNAYLVGETNGGIPQTAANVQPVSGGGTDAFAVKLSAKGVLVYSTYVGGSGNDIAYNLAIDGRGIVYAAGSTGSTEFTTPVFPLKGALQGQIGGARGGFGMLDAFVAKVNSCGSGLLYSSYFGGTFVDAATAIAVDGAGNAYVGGTTVSPNFPLSSNSAHVRSMAEGSVYRPSANNVFLAKITGAPEQPSKSCPIPLTFGLSAAALSVAATVPLTVTVRTAPFAKVALTLAIQNTVPPPPPAPTPTAVPGTKPVKVKLPHYPKVGEIIYKLHVGGTSDAYGLYVGIVRPKAVLTIAEPATLTIAATGSRSTVTNHAALTVGP
jgi:hypothetical protein